MPDRSGASAHSGLTLIELVIVMAILAVLASLAVFTLSGVSDEYRLARAVETFERFDARARREARNAQLPLQASVDRTAQRLAIATPGRRDAVRWNLPAAVQIERVRVGRQVAFGRRAEIRINRYGQSNSYAVLLQRGQRSRWLVVLGLSGQVIAVDSEREVDAILTL